MSPVAVAKMIRSFRITSRNEEYTDTERAWELLNAAEKALRSLGDRCPRCGEVPLTCDGCKRTVKA